MAYDGATPLVPITGGSHSGHGSNVGKATGNGIPSFSEQLSQTLANKAAPATGQNATQNPARDAHSQHFPLNNGAAHGGQDFQEMVLGIRAYRQQLIASNIANADTPGYKSVDIDFQEALRIAKSSMATLPLSLTVTTTGHIGAQAQSAESLYPIKYHVPNQASADGNTVEMDVERAKFAENSMMWEFSRDRVSGHFKHMMEMLQNLKD